MPCLPWIIQINHNITNNSREKITCHTQNVIYFLSCNQCNVQYVGETTLPLHKRINLHKRAKFGCKYVIKHFKDVCVGASLSVQIAELFPVTGYKNTNVSPVNRETRLDRKNYWIETLRLSYSYGLNKRERKADPKLPVGCSFPPIPRTRQRSARCRNYVNFDNLKDTESIFDCIIHNYITEDI